MSSSLSHSLSLNLRERSDTNQLQPTSIYICMYISTPSYKIIKHKWKNNITTLHTHNLSICCFLIKLFPSIMKHFNTNRPFTYTRSSMHFTLSFSENIAIMPILHPYCSCTSSIGSLIIPILLWHIKFLTRNIIFFVTHSLLIIWIFLHFNQTCCFLNFFPRHLLLQLYNIITAHPRNVSFKGLVWSCHHHLTIQYCPTYRLAWEYALTREKCTLDFCNLINQTEHKPAQIKNSSQFICILTFSTPTRKDV